MKVEFKSYREFREFVLNAEKPFVVCGGGDVDMANAVDDINSKLHWFSPFQESELFFTLDYSDIVSDYCDKFLHFTDWGGFKYESVDEGKEWLKSKGFEYDEVYCEFDWDFNYQFYNKSFNKFKEFVSKGNDHTFAINGIFSDKEIEALEIIIKDNGYSKFFDDNFGYYYSLSEKDLTEVDEIRILNINPQTIVVD